MTRIVSRINLSRNLAQWGVVAAVLLMSALLSAHPSLKYLVVAIVAPGAAVLLWRPILGLFALILAALLVPIAIGTGTDVSLNIATLLVPALLAIWVLALLRAQVPEIVTSRVNRPLMIFLLAGLLSLVIGNALWDPAVPRTRSTILVQAAQWAIFAFSAGIFWLGGNLVRTEIWLRRLLWTFLIVAGSLAIYRVLDTGIGRGNGIATMALDRAPFWLLLTAAAGGQLMFNRDLTMRVRVFLVAVLAACAIYALILERQSLSTVIAVGCVVGILAWLRWPRFRVAFVLLAVIGSVYFFPQIYSFAGGDAKWDESGGSRLALIGRVVEVTMRNPITGLGPAAYRSYARMQPLAYGGAYWVDPQVNSHNNYVDLFSHVGVLGMAIFAWFAVEVGKLGWQMFRRARSPFGQAYASAMVATWIGALVLMMFADWILPFVYNIGFAGFQASVLVWLFLGGLVTLEQIDRETPEPGV